MLNLNDKSILKDTGSHIVAWYDGQGLNPDVYQRAKTSICASQRIRHQDKNIGIIVSSKKEQC